MQFNPIKENTMSDLVKCTDCGVYTSNGPNHICVKWDASHACPDCGAASVFVHIAAPGSGSGWECKNGHFDGTVRLLTAADVI